MLRESALRRTGLFHHVGISRLFRLGYFYPIVHTVAMHVDVIRRRPLRMLTDPSLFTTPHSPHFTFSSYL